MNEFIKNYENKIAKKLHINIMNKELYKSHGLYEIVEMIDLFDKDNSSLCFIYTKRNNLFMLKVAFYNHSPITLECFNEAINNKNLECFKWLYKKSLHNNISYLSHQIVQNDLDDFYMWLLPNLKLDDYLMELIIKYNSDRCFDRICNIFIDNKNIILLCIKYDNLKFLKKIFKNTELNVDLTYGCRINCLKWLISKNCPINKTTIDIMSMKNYIEEIKYLNPQKDICSDAILIAGNNGNIKLIKYFKECGCCLDIKLFNNVINSGDILLLEWLYEKGCYYDDTSLKTSIICKNIYIFKWLLNIRDSCHLTENSIKIILKNDEYTFLKFINNLDKYINDKFLYRIEKYKSSKCLVYIYDLGIKIKGTTLVFLTNILQTIPS